MSAGRAVEDERTLDAIHVAARRLVHEGVSDLEPYADAIVIGQVPDATCTTCIEDEIPRLAPEARRKRAIRFHDGVKDSVAHIERFTRIRSAPRAPFPAAWVSMSDGK